MLNISNTGQYNYNFDSNCTPKYQPKVYLGTNNALSSHWIADTYNVSPSLSWPESF